MKTCMTFLSLRPYFFYPATRDISPEKQIYRDFPLTVFGGWPLSSSAWILLFSLA